MKNKDKVLDGIERLKSLVDQSLYDPIDQILKDYQVKMKRLDKIVIQGDRQQIAFLKLNEELRETSQKLHENQKIVEKA